LHFERREFAAGDAPGQAFPCLLQQIQRGRAQRQVQPIAPADAVRLVDEPAHARVNWRKQAVDSKSVSNLTRDIHGRIVQDIEEPAALPVRS